MTTRFFTPTLLSAFSVCLIFLSPSVARVDHALQPNGSAPMSNTDPMQSAAISCGETLSGSISAVGEQDTYTFSGNVGEAVNIAAVATSGSLCARVELYDPMGNLIAGTGAFVCNTNVGATLPVTGTYTILVRDFDLNSTGTYNVNLQFATGRCGTPITCGQPITISTPIVVAEQDSYTFNASAGEVVNIAAVATSGSLCARVELYGPMGNLIAGTGAFVCNTNVGATLPVTGTYTILVRDFDLNSAGTYNVNLQFATGRCGTPITCGQPITIGTPIVVAEQDSYTFNALAGEVVNISAVATLGPMCARVELYNPSGSLIAGTGAFVCNTNVGATLPVTGTYTILVRDFDLNSTGTYNVNLQFATGNCGMVIDCGETKSGIISNIAEQDAFVFCGIAGSSVNISAVATSGSLCARAELYDPMGNLIAGTGAFVCNTNVGATLPATGTYTILVRDFDLNSTGDYNVNLSCIGLRCCVYSISPADFSFPASGGTGSVNVTTQNNCTWTATSNDSWLTITSGSSGSGNGTVNYLVAANFSAGPRMGTLTVAGQTFTVTQAVLSPPIVRFSSDSNSVNEGGGRVEIGVSRLGDVSGAAAVDYKTSDTAGLNNCNVFNGIASSRCDYATSVGRVSFAAGETSKNISIPIVDDSYAEGNENFTITLSNATGATLGGLNIATVTINDNEAMNGPNPIDGTAFFVRQHYIDFLGREPDPPGFAAWQAVINNCPPGDTTCDRIHVSSAFFRSPEFQDRGYFVYRFYSVSFGRKPDYVEFIPDLARVSGFLSAAELEAAKVAFVNDFMLRPAFANVYNPLTNTQYVDTLLATAGVTSVNRDFWIAALTNGTRTRAQVLRDIAESTEVYNKYFNQAFVVMQYFGYLRRDPDALYLNWIQVLDTTGDFRVMVNGFMNSLEYRFRFGP